MVLLFSLILTIAFTVVPTILKLFRFCNPVDIFFVSFFFPSSSFSSSFTEAIPGNSMDAPAPPAPPTPPTPPTPPGAPPEGGKNLHISASTCSKKGLFKNVAKLTTSQSAASGLGVGSSVPASAVDGPQRIDELVVKYGVAARTLNIFLGSTMSEGRLDAVIMRLDRIASEDGKGRKTKVLAVASAGKRRVGASATDSRIVAIEDLLEVNFGGEGGGGFLSSLSSLSVDACRRCHCCCWCAARARLLPIAARDCSVIDYDSHHTAVFYPSISQLRHLASSMCMYVSYCRRPVSCLRLRSAAGGRVRPRSSHGGRESDPSSVQRVGFRRRRGTFP